MFFSLTVFALLFTSCSTDLLESAQPISETQTVSSRSSDEVNCEVAAFEIIIEEGILTLVNFDNDVENMVIEEVQSIDLINLSTGRIEVIHVNVVSFEIIIEEGILTFQLPPVDFGNFEIASQQTLNFTE